MDQASLERQASTVFKYSRDWSTVPAAAEYLPATGRVSPGWTGQLENAEQMRTRLLFRTKRRSAAILFLLHAQIH